MHYKQAHHGQRQPQHLHTHRKASTMYAASPNTARNGAESTAPTRQPPSYDAILQRLATFPPPLLPPGRAHHAASTADIAALQLHPTLEAALHILNHDLPSAHFLVRHMQAAPAVEGMMLHAILHRVEGDYDNARAWYRDVGKDGEGAKLFRLVWHGEGRDVDGESAAGPALDFVDEVEGLKKRKQGEKQTLAKTSLAELMAVLHWCERKFGTRVWDDASSAWSQDEKHIQTAQRMITGGEGYRKF